METIQSVLVGSSGGLDGFHRLEGGLLAGPCSSRLSQVSTVCGFWLSVSIPGSLLRSRLGPSGLHPGYGSDFVDPALHGYPSPLLSRRLAGPVSFSRSCSSRPPGGPRSVSGAGDCGESREVQLRSFTEGSVSGDNPGLPIFCGLSVPRLDRQAAVSGRRISVLRSAASLLLAVFSRHPVLSVSSCSRGQALHAVPAVSTAPVLGSPGRLGSRCLDSYLSPRPPRGGGGYLLSSPQRDSSENPPVVRASPYHSRPTVHPGLPHCPRGLSVSSSPDPGLRVDPSRGCVSGPLPSVAGDGRFACHLSKSPLFCLFLSLPGSSVCGDGRVSTDVGRSSRLRIPSLVRHSPGPGEASRFLGDLYDSGGSILASAPVVSRAPGSGGCSSGSAAVPPGSSVLTSVGSPLSGSPQASASCLETLRRFTRAAGFSSGVASQVGLARRSSSRTNYQLKWSTYRSWCRATGHSISRPSFSKVADFLLWLRRRKGLSVSSVMGYRSMLSAVFRFQLPGLSSHPVLRDLLRSFCLEAPSHPLRPPA